MFPGPNEIGSRIEDLKIEARVASRDALKKWMDIARLLVVLYDRHGYRGERYKKFAKAHGIGERDANSLYLLGKYADEILEECEINFRKHGANYEWPSWRQMRTAWKDRLRTEQPDDGTSDKAPEEEEEEGETATAKEDQVAALQRERDKLAAEVAAATRQARLEQSRREESEGHREADQKRHDDALTTLHEVLATSQDAERELHEKNQSLQAEHKAAQERFDEFAQAEETRHADELAALRDELAQRQNLAAQHGALLVLFSAFLAEWLERTPPEPPPTSSPEAAEPPAAPEPSPEPAAPSSPPPPAVAIVNVMEAAGTPMTEADIKAQLGNPVWFDLVFAAVVARGQIAKARAKQGEPERWQLPYKPEPSPAAPEPSPEAAQQPEPEPPAEPAPAKRKRGPSPKKPQA